MTDDERREPPGDEPTPDGGEPEVPPSTWAGRKRAEEEAGQDSSGFTDEFDEIARELDEQLDVLGAEHFDDEPPASPDASVEGDTLGELEDEEPAGPSAPQPDEAPPEDDEASPDADAAAPAPDEAPPEAGEPAPDGEEASPEPDASESDGDGAAPDAEEAEPTPEEAALAALKARAGASGWDNAAAGAPAGAPTRESAAAAAAPPAPETEVEEAPRSRPLWARFLAASLIIVASMAAATSISALVFLADFVKGFGGIEGVQKRLIEVDGGDPQTILILGSDKRPTDDTGRSDTTILLRVNPDRDEINMLSIPRDLRVSIPRHGLDKFNAAYSYGGPSLTLQVVQQITGLDIHHVVNINFTGFADAVNALNCVFIDVDRQYYVPEGSFFGGQQYSAIDPPINAGYQKLCGFKALQYVRYRVGDNDLVRSARQQDFVREARQKVEPRRVVFDTDYRDELLDVFREHTTSDNSLKDSGEVLDLLKTFVGASDASINEIPFPAQLGATYVTAGDKPLQEAIDEFLGRDDEDEAPAGGGGGDGGGGSDKQGGGKGGANNKPEPEPEPEGPILDDVTASGEEVARNIAAVKRKDGEPMIRFPIHYPTKLVPGSTITEESRAFPIDGPKKYYGYKIVVRMSNSRVSAHGLTQEYYGFSGTTWDDPPILENPSETREIDGRQYLLFWDGGRLRMVGWKEDGEAYWISNSLLQTVSPEEMLGIAKTMRVRGD